MPVGVPRFYVDLRLFLSAVKHSEIPTKNRASTLANLPPTNSETFEQWGIDENGDLSGWHYTEFNTSDIVEAGLEYNYFAAFGHNFADLYDHFTFYPEPAINSYDNMLNYSPWGETEYNGWSLATFTLSNLSQPIWLGYPIDSPNPASIPLKLSSLSVGKYFDMKNAPNLLLTENIEYGGTNEITSYNGSSYSNTMWNKPLKWGDSLGAWELEKPNAPQPQKLSRSGKRSWQLTFSFMDSSDLFGSNQMLTKYRFDSDDGIDTGDLDDNGFYEKNLLSDENFFSMWHFTLSGSIPFIFQKNKDNFDPDGFAMARFREGSLKATQKAPNLYDISVTIEETF